MGPFSPAEYYWLIGLGVGLGFFGALIGAGGGFPPGEEIDGRD